MAADPRLSDVARFVREHLAAEADLTIAALSEPDDDTYLAAASRASAFYATATASPLLPLEGRWAVPGGTTTPADRDAGRAVAPGRLFAVGALPDGAFVAFVGARRDADGRRLAEALQIRRTPEGLRITGRASSNPFARAVAFEASGGDPVDLTTPPTAVRLETPPGNAGHAAFLRSWCGGAAEA